MAAETPKVHKGLLGVVADRTAVSTVGKHSFGLTYRGYKIEDLAEHCIFEEVAYLLMRGHLPTQTQLNRYMAKMASERGLPPALRTALEQLPRTAHPMDVLRTVASVTGCTDREQDGGDTAADTCDKLIAKFVSGLCYWYHYANFGQRIALDTDASHSLAHAFVAMLHQAAAPDSEFVRTVDQSLILYGEHDFNASTFTARVIASTLSDTYSCITGAIGALRGPLHGGANEAVQHMLQDVGSVADGLELVKDMLSRKELVMGFGHRIYKAGDPRNAIFKRISQKLSQRADGNKVLYDVSCAIEEYMGSEKKMFPNADFFAASAYHQARIPTDFFTPLFVVARTAGWCAHIKEQRVGNKIIRPSSAYDGPPLKEFVKLGNRGGVAKL